MKLCRMGIHFRGRCPACRREQRKGIIGPASGEVYTLCSVGAGLVLPLQEHHLISVVKLGDAAHSCKERQGKFHALRILLEGVSGTGMVVVGKKGEHMTKVLVHEVLGQNRIDAGHTLIPEHFILHKRRMDGLLQREIHNGREV